MLIDAHNHPNWHGHNAKKILENMDAQGIDKMWLLTWECGPEDYSQKTNAHLPIGKVAIPGLELLDGGFAERREPDHADREWRQ